MRPLAAPLLFVLLVATRPDGMKFRSDGRPVPEREQRALIELADATETLSVAPHQRDRFPRAKNQIGLSSRHSFDG